MSPEDVLTALQECWCEQLGDTVAVCCITASVPVVPECCAGFAWVRLVGAYPSMNFPALLGTPERCRIDTWALTVEIGVVRCVDPPCDALGQPCCDAELVGAIGVLDDFARMRRTFSCCLPTIEIVTQPFDEIEKLRSDEIIPGTFAVGTPQALCLPRSMQATIFTSSPCSCA